MNGRFSVMEQHLEAPRTPAAAGKLVLSRLGPGSSMIGARAPSVKLVLDGEELYQVEGRTFRVQPGQFLYLDAGADCIGSNRVETTGLCLMLPIAEGQSDGRDGPTDGILGRALALSTQTSRMGETLLRYGRAIARDPELGERLAPEIIDRVGAALAEPLAESRRRSTASRRPSPRPGATSTSGSSARGRTCTSISTAA